MIVILVGRCGQLGANRAADQHEVPVESTVVDGMQEYSESERSSADVGNGEGALSQRFESLGKAHWTLTCRSPLASPTAVK